MLLFYSHCKLPNQAVGKYYEIKQIKYKPYKSAELAALYENGIPHSVMGGGPLLRLNGDDSLFSIDPESRLNWPGTGVQTTTFLPVQMMDSRPGTAKCQESG